MVKRAGMKPWGLLPLSTLLLSNAQAFWKHPRLFPELEQSGNP
jgi:hypothetical protein